MAGEFSGQATGHRFPTTNPNVLIMYLTTEPMLLRQEKNYKQEEGGQETNVLFTHDFLHMETEMQRAPYIKENRAPAGVARCLACARRVLGSIPSLVRGLRSGGWEGTRSMGRCHSGVSPPPPSSSSPSLPLSLKTDGKYFFTPWVRI